MKILITGGAGFIGSHLGEKFLENGDEVQVLDDLSTGSLNNIEHLRAHPEYAARFDLTVGTILDRSTLRPLIEKSDLIVHLAAAVGVKYIIDNPLSSIQTNVTGTEIVLELASRFKKKIFLASTSEVYGKQTHAPLKETDDLVLGQTGIGRWSYACGKAIDEFLALAYHKEKKLAVTIVRFFNTVGPRQTGRYGMVIPTFVKRALLNHVLMVHGDGSQTRTFGHVQDIVRGLIELSKRDDTAGEVFNIGGRGEISIMDLAKKACSLCVSESEIKCVPYSEAFEKDFEDMPRRVPDLSKIHTWTGYEPRFSLDDILNDIIEFERS